MDTRPEYQENLELLARQRLAHGLALEKHTSPPPTRQQLQGELRCRLLEVRHLNTEIDELTDQLARTPA
jgi:hypothetical protein